MSRVVSPAELARTRRVAMLVFAIVVLSIADLYFTLTFLLSTGMVEANPVARLVIEQGSPWVLGAWKLAMVLLPAAIFLCFSKRKLSEAAAWVCFIALGALAVQWKVYTDRVHEMTPYISMLYQDSHGVERPEGWVCMTKWRDDRATAIARR
ncbi:MAG: hypothetical protein JJU33_08255 [Phycisphaerales bacterium]|nr:hypothetical protein [Phycisphaerales bacterium]